MSEDKLVFGEKEFSIELYHEPIDQGPWLRCGRLHFCFGSAILGDLSEEKCNFSGVYERLSEIASGIDELVFSDDSGFSDKDIFHFLNNILYVDSGQSDVEIAESSNRYSKYNFMTNVSEIFDRTKSFIFTRPETGAVSICFQTTVTQEYIHCHHIDKRRFVEAIWQFQRWYENVSRDRYFGKGKK